MVDIEHSCWNIDADSAVKQILYSFLNTIVFLVSWPDMMALSLESVRKGFFSAVSENVCSTILFSEQFYSICSRYILSQIACAGIYILPWRLASLHLYTVVLLSAHTVSQQIIGIVPILY